MVLGNGHPRPPPTAPRGTGGGEGPVCERVVVVVVAEADHEGEAAVSWRRPPWTWVPPYGTRKPNSGAAVISSRSSRRGDAPMTKISYLFLVTMIGVLLALGGCEGGDDDAGDNGDGQILNDRDDCDRKHYEGVGSRHFVQS